MSSLFLVYKLLKEGILFLLIPGWSWNYGNTLSYFYPHWNEKFGMFSWTFKCFSFYPSLLIISSSVCHTEKSLTSHLRILFLFYFISFPYRVFLVWVIIYWGHVHCFLLYRSIFHPKMHHQIHWRVYQSWKVATCAKDCNWRTTGLRVFAKLFFTLE